MPDVEAQEEAGDQERHQGELDHGTRPRSRRCSEIAGRSRRARVSGLMKVYACARRWMSSTDLDAEASAAFTLSRCWSVRDTVVLSQHSATGHARLQEGVDGMAGAALHRAGVLVAGEAALDHDPVRGPAAAGARDRRPPSSRGRCASRPGCRSPPRRTRGRRVLAGVGGQAEVAEARDVVRALEEARRDCRARGPAMSKPDDARCARGDAAPRRGPGGRGSSRCGGRAGASR